jgi:HK97 family phage major capsid protein
MTAEEIKKLKETMQKLFAEMELAGSLVAQEEEKGANADEAQVKGLKEAYAKKEIAWKKSHAEVKQAMEMYNRKREQEAMLKELDTVSEDDVDTRKKSFGTHQRVDAQAKDVMKDMEDHTHIFNKYLAVGRKQLSGQENELIRPKSEKIVDGAEGAVAPPHIVHDLFGAKWMRDVGLTKELAYLQQKGTSTMLSSSDTLGGYTVPQDYRLPVLSLPYENPFILQRATVIPAPTGTVTMPQSLQTDTDEYGGFAGAWISEGGLKQKTDTQFAQVQIDTHEYAAYTQLSVRLLERSAIAMESYISDKGRSKIMNELNRVFLRGTGTGQPYGILNTAGIRTVNREVANQVSRVDAVRLKRELRPQHRANGTYILADEVGGYFEELTVSATDLRPLFSASMANGPYDRLLGRPYIETTQLPNLGTEGDACYCDLREYYVAMESEVVVKRSDDYDIVHNLATIVIYVVVGGLLVHPRVCAVLDTPTGS